MQNCFFLVFFVFFGFSRGFLLSQAQLPKNSKKTKKNKKNKKTNPVRRILGKSMQNCFFCFFLVFLKVFALPSPFFSYPHAPHQPFNLQTKIWRWPGFLYFPFLPLRLLAVERLVEYFGIMFKWSFQNKMLSSTQKRCECGFIEFKKKFFLLIHALNTSAILVRTFFRRFASAFFRVLFWHLWLGRWNSSMR